MQPVATEFEDRTFRYAQLVRQGRVAIYRQTHKTGGAVRYEVVQILEAPEQTLPSGAVLPPREVYPSSSAWGRLGHTFHTEPDARAQFARLCASQVEQQP